MDKQTPTRTKRKCANCNKQDDSLRPIDEYKSKWNGKWLCRECIMRIL